MFHMKASSRRRAYRSVGEFQEDHGLKTRNVITINDALNFTAWNHPASDDGQQNVEVRINLVECKWPRETEYFLQGKSHIRYEDSIAQCFRAEVSGEEFDMYTECIRFSQDENGVICLSLCDLEGNWNHRDRFNSLGKFYISDAASIQGWLERNGITTYGGADYNVDYDYNGGTDSLFDNTSQTEEASIRYYRPHGFRSNLVPIEIARDPNLPSDIAPQPDPANLHVHPEGILMRLGEEGREMNEMRRYWEAVAGARAQTSEMTGMGQRLMNLEQENAHLRALLNQQYGMPP